MPNCERAVVSREKLTDYCLNPLHTEGGAAKARAFSSALGITKVDAEYLEQALLTAARGEDAEPKVVNQFGRRYEVKFSLVGLNGKTHPVKSGWIIRPDEDFPRLTSCYVDL